MDFLSSLVHISRSYLRLPMLPLEAEVRLCIVVLDVDFFYEFCSISSHGFPTWSRRYGTTLFKTLLMLRGGGSPGVL